MQKATTQGTVEMKRADGTPVRVSIRVWPGGAGWFWACAKSNNRGHLAKHATRGAALAWAFTEAQGLVEKGVR